MHALCSPAVRPRSILVAALLVGGCAGAPVAPTEDATPRGTPVEAQTAEGPVRGLTDGAVFVFKGIPYAAPAAGVDRWRPPKPPAARADVFDASRFGPACEQTVASIPTWMLSEAGEVALYEMSDLQGFAAQEKSGDCLRLNIWTPVRPVPVPVEGPPAAGLPVIVHLHGGGLTSGSAQHRAQDGRRLAQKGVLFVSINYRLGAIGFLAGDGLFEGDVMAGNRGFMDTVQALTWVRDNIAQFGGDPDNVTLMGQSGGGTNVWSTLASPAAEGLVRRAIIMSGPIYDYPIEEHRKLTTDVLEQWGAHPGDVASLGHISDDDAASTASTTTLVGSDGYGSMSRTYLPSAGATGTAFLPDDTLTAIEKGRLDKIDILAGTCDDDAKVSIIMVPLPNFFAIDIWNGYIGGLIADTDEGYDAMTDKYIAARPAMGATRAKEQLQTDALYRIRTLRAAAEHSARTPEDGQGRTYVYQFSWKTPAFPDDLGAMHGMDLIFASGNIASFPRALGIHDGHIDVSTQRLSDQMLDAWVNFAKTGTPSSDALPAWPEYEPGQRQTMVFDVESKVVSDPDGDLRRLWE